PEEIKRMGESARGKLADALQAEALEQYAAKNDAAAERAGKELLITGSRSLSKLLSPKARQHYLWRNEADRAKVLKAIDGGEKTEAAVARGLAWLAKQQDREKGCWEFDGSHKDSRIAATGLCLLPFLADGNTPDSGKYKDAVGKGVSYLKKQM